MFGYDTTLNWDQMHLVEQLKLQKTRALMAKKALLKKQEEDNSADLMNRN